MVHGAVHSLLKAIVAIFSILLCGLAFLVWRLSVGPVEIDFIAPYLAEALSSEQRGYIFDVRGAYVEWDGFNSPPLVTILNVTAAQSDGSILASFPEMKVALSIKSILDGTPYPKEVILEKPTLRFSRQDDGQVLLGLEPLNFSNSVQGESDSVDADSKSKAPIDSESELLNAVVIALSDPALSNSRVVYLSRVQIRDATIEFVDQASGTEWIIPSGMLAIERSDDGLQLEIELPYTTDGRASALNGSGTFNKAKELLSLKLDFDGIRPSAFSTLTPLLSVLNGADLNIDGTLELDVEIRKALPVLVEARLAVARGQGELALPLPIGRSYPVNEFSLRAFAGSGLRSFSIEDFAVSIANDGPTAKGSLQGGWVEDAPKISANLQINEVTLKDIQRYWPQDIKPNTRSWIATNLNGGTVSAANFDIEAGGTSLETVAVKELFGTADIKDVDVTYLRQMPAVRKVSGAMTLTTSEVTIDIASGYVNETITGENLEVNDGRVRLHGLDSEAHAADIDIRVSGQISDAVSLIDNPPLKYAKRLGLAAEVVSGSTELLLSIDFPLIKEVTLADVEVNATASLQNIKIEKSAFGIAVESGQFTLAVDNLGMDIVGTGSLNGVRSGVTWRENFSGESFRRQYALDAIMESQQLSVTGLAPTLIAPQFINGPIRTEVIYTVNRDERETLIIEADLGLAELHIPYLNWSKAPNIPALFNAEANISDGKLISIQRFQVRSDESDLALSGRLDFQNNGVIQSLRLDRSKIGLSELELIANNLDNEVIEIEARGPFLDGRAFWQSFTQSNRTRSLAGSSVKEAKTAFRFRGQIENVLLSENSPISNVTSEIEQSVTGLTIIKIEGVLENNKNFVFDLSPSGQERVFTTSSTDSGALFKALGLSQNVVGGDLSLAGTIQVNGSINGTLGIKTFKIKDAPILARLLSVASLTGIVDELQGDGLSFSRLNAPFNYSDQKLEINNGAMYGTSIGLTTAGQYDVANNTLTANGTIVPAYALNSALGSIPLIGPMLTGGEEDGGIFAATYAIRGQADGTEITVNPLATLTPGFLRGIFSVFDPPQAANN
ncbi:MAG: AsmA-like C-terminal domain-containing protein [Rhodospirillaceae bacterium]